MLKAAKAYLSTQVTTATQGDVLLLLYDTAIKHIKLAKDKMAERDFAAKGILISKAIEIVSELHASLNKEKGGEVAKNLSKLYFLCNTRLLQANMEMSPARLDEVVGILSGLRQAFAQIIPGQEGMAPASQSAVLRPGAEPVPTTPEQASAPAAAPLPTYQLAYPAANSVAAKPPSAIQELAPQPGPAKADSPVETGVAEAAALAAEPAPLNTVRSRAANAYANSR